MLCYNIIILAPIATIFIHQTDSSVLNLKGASAKYVTCSLLAWKSSIVRTANLLSQVRR